MTPTPRDVQPHAFKPYPNGNAPGMCAAFVNGEHCHWPRYAPCHLVTRTERQLLSEAGATAAMAAAGDTDGTGSQLEPVQPALWPDQDRIQRERFTSLNWNKEREDFMRADEEQAVTQQPVPDADLAMIEEARTHQGRLLEVGVAVMGGWMATECRISSGLLSRLADRVEALARAAVEGREDTARLDWCDKRGAYPVYGHGEHMSVREAIDDEMRMEEIDSARAASRAKGEGQRDDK